MEGTKSTKGGGGRIELGSGGEAFQFLAQWRARGCVNRVGNVAALAETLALIMATEAATVEFILSKLRDRKRFTARAMFGEYALYCDGKVVALVCDNLLHVKIVPASSSLETICEQGPPYPRAKQHYIVDEGQLSTITELPGILLAIATSLSKKGKTSHEKMGVKGPRRGTKGAKKNFRGQA